MFKYVYCFFICWYCWAASNAGKFKLPNPILFRCATLVPDELRLISYFLQAQVVRAVRVNHFLSLDHVLNSLLMV